MITVLMHEVKTGRPFDSCHSRAMTEFGRVRTFVIQFNFESVRTGRR